MPARLTLVLAVAAATLVSADWNVQGAADYLDQRQEAWFTWPAANEDKDGPCLSCHTGLPYLLARPGLRHALGERAPTKHEVGLLDAVRRRILIATPDRFAP